MNVRQFFIGYQYQYEEFKNIRYIIGYYRIILNFEFKLYCILYVYVDRGFLDIEQECVLIIFDLFIVFKFFKVDFKYISEEIVVKKGECIEFEILFVGRNFFFSYFFLFRYFLILQK